MLRAKRSSVVGISGLLGLSLALTGCSAIWDSSPDWSADPVSTPVRTATSPPAGSTPGYEAVLDTGLALPAASSLADQRVVKSDQGGGTLAYPLDIAADGTALMSIGPQDTGTELQQKRLELWTTTGSTSVVADGKSTRQGAVAQTIAADLCGGTPVWADAHGTEVGTADWRAWSLPKGRSKPVQLGDSSRFGTEWSGPDAITTDATTAYWALSRTGPQRKSMIVSRPLDGSKKLTVVAKDGKLPVALPDRLLYVTDTGPADRFQIRQVKAGKDTLVRDATIPKGSELTAFTAGSNWLIWVVRHTPTEQEEDEGVARSTMTIWPTSWPNPMIVHLHGDGTSALHLSENLLVWGNGSGSGDAGMYLLDLAPRTIYKLGELEGGSNATVCGTSVSWTLPGKGPTFDHAIARWTFGTPG